MEQKKHPFDAIVFHCFIQVRKKLVKYLFINTFRQLYRTSSTLNLKKNKNKNKNTNKPAFKKRLQVTKESLMKLHLLWSKYCQCTWNMKSYPKTNGLEENLAQKRKENVPI